MGRPFCFCSIPNNPFPTDGIITHSRRTRGSGGGQCPPFCSAKWARSTVTHTFRPLREYSFKFAHERSSDCYSVVHYFIVCQRCRLHRNRCSNSDIIIIAMETSWRSTAKSENPRIDEYDDKPDQPRSFSFPQREPAVPAEQARQTLQLPDQ